MKTTTLLIPALMLSSCLLSIGCTQSAEDDPRGASQSAQTAVAKPGEYMMKLDSRAGILRVTKVTGTSLDFSLDVWNLQGSNASGRISGTARGGVDGYFFLGDGCDLTFSIKDTSITIVQDHEEGNCGLGAGASAGGKYTPRPPTVSLCATGEEVLFACQATNSKLISICERGGAVQYRYGKKENVELKLPKAMSAASTDVVEGGAISEDGGGWATFHNGSFDYIVFAAPSSVDGSGVIVKNNGSKVSMVSCETEPTTLLPASQIPASSKTFDLDDLAAEP